MAQTMLSEKKFQDRGYLWHSPTLDECNEMGWTLVQALKYCRINDVYVADMKQWCKANVWWQDYVWSYSDVSFKHERDATMFLLRWS